MGLSLTTLFHTPDQQIRLALASKSIQTATTSHPEDGSSSLPPPLPRPPFSPTLQSQHAATGPLKTCLSMSFFHLETSRVSYVTENKSQSPPSGQPRPPKPLPFTSSPPLPPLPLGPPLQAQWLPHSSLHTGPGGPVLATLGACDAISPDLHTTHPPSLQASAQLSSQQTQTRQLDVLCSTHHNLTYLLLSRLLPTGKLHESRYLVLFTSFPKNLGQC